MYACIYVCSSMSGHRWYEYISIYAYEIVCVYIWDRVCVKERGGKRGRRPEIDLGSLPPLLSAFSLREFLLVKPTTSVANLASRLNPGISCLFPKSGIAGGLPTHSTSTWVKCDQSLVLTLIGKVLFVLLSCLSSPLPDTELSLFFSLFFLCIYFKYRVKSTNLCTL